MPDAECMSLDAADVTASAIPALAQPPASSAPGEGAAAVAEVAARMPFHLDGDPLATTSQLRTITDALPGLVAFIGVDRRYHFVSAAYERWFGRPRAEMVGATVEEVVGAAAYGLIEPRLTRALAGEEQRFEAELPYRDGGTRAVEAHYLSQRDALGQITGCVVLVVDIGDRRAFERFRVAATARAERLLHITAAIADAVDADEVFAAVVDQVGDALGASNVALWLLDGDGDTVRIVRSVGYGEESQRRFAASSLASAAPFPALDAIRRRAPLWIPSKAALLRDYPHLASASSSTGYRIACLPLTSRAGVTGALGIGIADEREFGDDDRDFLQLVARYASQAIERVRLLDAERRSRAEADLLADENQAARARAEQLYRFADAVVSAERIEDVYDVALGVIAEALGTARAAILVCDGDGVMRFRAARGLSDEYRAAVEGHSPWPRDVVAPRPVVVEDAAADDGLAAYRALFAREGIGALAFFPLATQGPLSTRSRLIGKFMVYHDAPHAFSKSELELATAIGNHLASVIARFAAIGELEDTIRYNELFAGVLAHDLRNPLGAMMTAAQIMLMRQDGEGDRHIKPVGRIMASGQRMTRMIDQLLDFTRARVGGGIEVRPRAANLGELCGQAIGELELANPDWKIERGVLGDLDGEWDPDRLLQIISNLIGNAGQHGDQDAGILVLLDGRTPAQVTLRVHNKGAIPPALVAGLFDPFRATRHRRDQSRGLGLGLFIVKELIRAHGGTVDVSSTEAAGTTFTIVLPRHAPAARAASAPP